MSEEQVEVEAKTVIPVLRSEDRLVGVPPIRRARSIGQYGSLPTSEAAQHPQSRDTLAHQGPAQTGPSPGWTSLRRSFPKTGHSHLSYPTVR